MGGEFLLHVRVAHSSLNEQLSPYNGVDRESSTHSYLLVGPPSPFMQVVCNGNEL